MRILLVQLHPTEDGDLAAEALARRSVPYTVAHLYNNEAPPDLARFDAIAVFGSPESCRQLCDHPHLQQVEKLVLDCIAADTPVLGICFGAQLLAQVLGSPVRKNDRPEIGAYEVALTEAGRRSPLFAGFPPMFLAAQWHEDTFDVPPNATLLASSETCRSQAFSFRRSVGLQFHIEASPRKFANWAAQRPDQPPRIGKTPGQVLAELNRLADAQARLCDRFVENFLGALVR